LVNSSVGSSPGTTGLEATIWWPFDSKNFRKVERISEACIAVSSGTGPSLRVRLPAEEEGALALVSQGKKQAPPAGGAMDRPQILVEGVHNASA
jgi:hypothetical protein